MPVRLAVFPRANGHDVERNSPRPLRASSRADSPLPHRSSSSDDTSSPLLGSNGGPTPWDDAVSTSYAESRRRRSREFVALRPIKRVVIRALRSPWCPARPITILVALAFSALSVTSITYFLIWFLNPDKTPLPWRAYCSVPPDAPYPPALDASRTDTVSPKQLLALANMSLPFADPSVPLFPPPDLGFDWEQLPPAGVFLGILTIDSAVERRMLARTTWATHPFSRNGAGAGDAGRGTSRTVVRFILGQPKKEWERRIRLEMELYRDIVILPITENMNSGKTHAFFNWAATYAWVPPAPQQPEPSHVAPYQFSYTASTMPAPPLAAHDPPNEQNWVRPDFVLKADDDAFIMLAELEARLRIELHDARTASRREANHARARQAELDSGDPMTYWGYLVKNQFMAGELYGMSWKLVQWVASERALRKLVDGAEDKQTAKWMRLHPQASSIRWKSEHCWIYDHPRANKVYAHGFLFPSEVERVRSDVRATMRTVEAMIGRSSASLGNSDSSTGVTTESSQDQSALDDTQQLSPSTSVEALSASSWYSSKYQQYMSNTTVSVFGGTYVSPVAGSDGGPDGIKWSVEALVEGSVMSSLGSLNLLPLQAYRARESRQVRYQDRRVGGTIAVHFLKQIPWYLETAMAFLEEESG